MCQIDASKGTESLVALKQEVWEILQKLSRGGGRFSPPPLSAARVKTCWVYWDCPTMLETFHHSKIKISKNSCFFKTSKKKSKRSQNFSFKFLFSTLHRALYMSLCLSEKISDPKLDNIYLCKIAVEIFGL